MDKHFEQAHICIYLKFVMGKINCLFFDNLPNIGKISDSITY